MGMEAFRGDAGSDPDDGRVVIAVRAPRWAVAEGMPEPEPDESFETYWHRMGVPHGVVSMALANLDPRVEDVANDRMADYVRRVCPNTFTKHVMGLASDQRFRYAYRNEQEGRDRGSGRAAVAA